MAKTLVAATHALAAWLNGLGDDADYYIRPTVRCPEGTTVGQVRDNYIRTYGHVTAVAPRLATLRAEERQTAARLRRLRRDIRALEARQGVER